jgi:hypothetical protein
MHQGIILENLSAYRYFASSIPMVGTIGRVRPFVRFIYSSITEVDQSQSVKSALRGIQVAIFHSGVVTRRAVVTRTIQSVIGNSSRATGTLAFLRYSVSSIPHLFVVRVVTTANRTIIGDTPHDMVTSRRIQVVRSIDADTPHDAVVTSEFIQVRTIYSSIGCNVVVTRFRTSGSTTYFTMSAPTRAVRRPGYSQADNAHGRQTRAVRRSSITQAKFAGGPSSGKIGFTGPTKADVEGV